MAGCLSDDADTDLDDTGRQGPMMGDVELSSSFPIALYDAEHDDLVADLHHHEQADHSHWHRIPLVVEAGTTRSVRIEIQDAYENELSIRDELAIDVAVTDSETLHASITVDQLNLTGRVAGETLLTFTLGHDTGSWTTPPLAVEVI